ncbi:hypothetical protein FRUB_08264 [Fimbriiglobus ruber]|uniref:Uncharacterized protein n=2 Tax=Fimbriiglobus ruber TaxID=1908690 RepID=A0A225D290_9BACT|nr:hypothetical protein FRUB_08264 [Fimbriiglobus ruber]
MGKPVEAMKHIVSEGHVGAAEVVKAFKSMTEEGGRFYGMSDKYSKSFAGQVEQLKDGYEILKREFGQALIEELRLPEAIGDLGKFTDRVRGITADVRPAIAMRGDLGRAGVQAGFELGKAFLLLEKVQFDGILHAVPALRDVANSAREVIKDLANFETDPIEVAVLGKVLAAQFTFGLSTIAARIEELAKQVKTEFADPFVAAVKEIRKVAAAVREVIKEAKGRKADVNGKITGGGGILYGPGEGSRLTDEQRKLWKDGKMPYDPKLYAPGVPHEKRTGG